MEEASIIITQYIIAILFPIWDISKNTVKEFFHFIAKLIVRSFCGFSLPTATRSAGLAVGVPPCGRLFPSLRHYRFYRVSQQRRTSLRMSFVFSCIRDKSAHNPLIPNICIQTSHKGANYSLFEGPKASLVKGRGTAEGGGGILFPAEVPKDRIPQSPPDGGDSPLSQGGLCTNPNKEEFYLWQVITQPIIS